MDEERGYGGVRVVSIQDTDKRTPVQELQGMEGAAEDLVGRGTKGDGEREELFHDPRPPSGRTCTGAVLGILRTTKVGAGWARGRCHRNRARNQLNSVGVEVAVEELEARDRWKEPSLS